MLAAMLKGAFIGLVLFVAGDAAFNDGRYVHIATAKIVSFAHASSAAIGDSIFSL